MSKFVNGISRKKHDVSLKFTNVFLKFFPVYQNTQQEAHSFTSFFSVLCSKMSMITADRVACHDIGIVTVAKDYAFV